MLLLEYVWQLLYADDFKWNVHGAIKYYNLLLIITVQLAWGMPLAVTKFLGGIEVDWVGY